MHNLAYGLWTIKKRNGQAINDLYEVSNQIGNYAFNEEGAIGAPLT